MPKRPLVSPKITNKLRSLLTAQRDVTDTPVNPTPAQSRPNMIEEAVELLREHEGFRPKAYQDDGGKWTIGYGQATPDIKPGMETTKEEALKFARGRLREDSTIFADRDVPLSAGLLSATYNLGQTKARRYGIPQALKRGDYDEAERILKSLIYAEGKLQRGLPKRRVDEVASIRRSEPVPHNIIGLPKP